MTRFFASLFAVLMLAMPAWATDDENTLVITVEGAANGEIEIELANDVAPLHAERLKELARSGAYDGVVFHRVIYGFMAQTGDVQFGKSVGYKSEMAGRGSSDLPNLKEEFSDIDFVEGVVGMARSSDVNSGNSQFFIMFDEAPFLNGQYTVVGKVIAGQDLVHNIRKGNPALNGTVAEPDKMVSVRVKSDK